MRALFLRIRNLIGMAFYLFFLKVASLPTTFSTPWRGHPNTTEQCYVYPGKFKAACPCAFRTSHNWSGLVGGFAKTRRKSWYNFRASCSDDAHVVLSHGQVRRLRGATRRRRLCTYMNCSRSVKLLRPEQFWVDCNK